MSPRGGEGGCDRLQFAGGQWSARAAATVRPEAHWYVVDGRPGTRCPVSTVVEKLRGDGGLVAYGADGGHHLSGDAVCDRGCVRVTEHRQQQQEPVDRGMAIGAVLDRRDQ